MSVMYHKNTSIKLFTSFSLNVLRKDGADGSDGKDGAVGPQGPTGDDGVSVISITPTLQLMQQYDTT